MRNDRASTARPRAPAESRPTPERIAAIRARIASGAYDDPEVVRAVASRILRSGDLDGPPPGTG